MSVVHFPSYRDYEADRIRASDAMMALLAGSRLAENMLSLTEGSTHLLPEIFPAVPHIRRMNLSTGDARSLLSEAEKHLGAMAVPYALALHEDFVHTCFELLRSANMITKREIADTNASSMHRVFQQKTSSSIPSDSMEQFHLLRLMRNAVIHAGGKPKPSLITSANSLPPGALAQWKKITGYSPSQNLQLGSPVTFTHAELILCLAVTKRISQEMNLILRDALPRSIWADIALKDFDEQHSNLRHIEQKRRSLGGFLRTFYQPLRFEPVEISSAETRAGWQ